MSRNGTGREPRREPRGAARRIVVIGAGMAAGRLAQRLATVSAGRPLDLTLIGEEPHAPYNRVLLADVLAGRYAPDVIRLPAPPAAVTRRHARAVRIDRDTRTVQCDDGTSVPYDRLVLATGSNPVLPPLRGLFQPGGGDLPAGVHPFRTLADCEALRAAAGDGTKAVVIGGGLLGVSAARALALRGAHVVLAHQGEHLMERHLDTHAADLLRRHLEDLGVEVHTECRVRGLRTRQEDEAVADRTVTAVELADGFALQSDLVILACGVRPRVGLAQAAGLAVRKGVEVDDQLRTSDPHIYAIGDCAEHDGTTYGLAGAAVEQAEVAAQVIANPHTGSRYTGTRALTRLTLGAEPADTPFDLAAFGDTTPHPDDDVVHLTDATRRTYRKVVVRGDRLVGGILLGDLATVGNLALTWETDEALPDSPLLHLITDNGGS
ncbi:NAD(P)/FAD-dependent oxidoreductase [Streptomyces boninensis]|uniref:NAD(P)/FAD-dependent oxidoreductase n=1 Tax=Streptomyces boninensis TaxID=2039455 RepID=UPI003B2180A8